ncbi:MAG TPA: FAD-dependent oxidoreductase [Halomicronema sp.]
MAKEYDLVIIGGGSGGLVVASAAAQLKAKVALVESERLGGDCLWYGCVPSKSLLHAADIAYKVKNSGQFGINYQNLEIDFAKVIGHIEQAIATIEPHDSPTRFESLGVEVIFGQGEFISPHQFTVNNKILTARAFVIATGSRPFIPEIEGLKECGYLTNKEVFSLNKLPKSITVIGAGPMGCELGQAFARLGSQVTLIAKTKQILAKEDWEAAEVVETQLQAEGIEIFKNTQVNRVKEKRGEKVIWSGQNQLAKVEEILVAAGRLPNVELLNLPAAGVDVGRDGIVVNDKLQTSNRKIYACGDVIGGYRFTHAASYEAQVVLKNALFLPVWRRNYRVMPRATFTQPELASVGMTEAEARVLYRDQVCVLKQEFAGVDRAIAESHKEGFVKIITRKNGEILGAHLVGTRAGELLHEIVLAMTHKLKVSALTSMIHVYPTLSEVSSKAALQLTKQNYARNLGLQGFLERFFFLWRRL